MLNQPRLQKPRPSRQAKGWLQNPSISPSMRTTPESIPRSRSLSEQGTLFSPAPHFLQSNNSQFFDSGLSPSIAGSSFSTVGPDAWSLDHLALGQINSRSILQTFGDSMQGLPGSSSNNMDDSTEAPLNDQVPTSFYNQDESLSSLSFNINDQLFGASQDITALWSNAPSDFK